MRFAFVGSSISGNPWIGLLVAVVCALLVGMLHSFCCISLGINQGVVAVAINILCSGLCGTMMRTLYGSASAVPRCRGFGPLPVPGLSNIPFIGSIIRSALANISKFNTYSYHLDLFIKL